MLPQRVRGGTVNHTGQATLPILPEEGSARLDPGGATQGQQSVISLFPSSDQPESYRSPFLTETGRSYCSSSRVVDRESEQGLQSFPSELVLVAELIMLLDSMGAKKKGLEEVLKWHSKATLRNANFMNVRLVTREANMIMIRNAHLLM